MVFNFGLIKCLSIVFGVFKFFLFELGSFICYRNKFWVRYVRLIFIFVRVMEVNVELLNRLVRYIFKDIFGW